MPDRLSALMSRPLVIDARTPEVFAAGHLDGAVLATLEPIANYVVYCRSGNRSAQAVTRMREASIGNVVDSGSLENALAVVGRAIVTR